jgi:hypothetical protein
MIFGGVPTDEQVDALKKEVDEEVQREKSNNMIDRNYSFVSINA